MKTFAKLIYLILLFFALGCEQPMDPKVAMVTETNEILRSNTWTLEQFLITVKNTDIPPPILVNSDDSLIQAGNYDLEDMAPDASDLTIYEMQFTEENDIITKEIANTIFFDSAASYFVFNGTTIRISNAAVDKLNYEYYYNSTSLTMSFTLTEEQASKMIDNVNQKLLDDISSERPTKVGEAVSYLLFNNEKLQEKINDFLVAAIAGKISGINDFNPETAADTLAQNIMESIDSVDWNKELTQEINEALQKITSINADSVSVSMAEEISETINEQLSVDNLYNALLPFMDNLAQDPENTAEQIAVLIKDLIYKVFDQDHLQEIISTAWEQFTEMDEQEVDSISGILTDIVEDRWINAENLAGLFLPFTSQIEDTPLTQMGDLASQATDSLEQWVDELNEKFPETDLDPDYDQVSNAIYAIMVAAKPLISVAGGAESAADSIAQLILDDFLTGTHIQDAFESAINYLQAIDPDQAGQTIATWLVNLEGEIDPELVEKLTQLLSPILQNMDPDYTAFKIAEAINTFVTENITEESLQSLILPLLQKVTNLNTEALASVIAGAILNSSIIQDNITQDNIEALLLPVLQKIQGTDVDQVAQQIVDALMNNNVVKTIFTPEHVANIIAFILYKEAWDNVKIANNFEEVSIVLSHE